LESSEKCGIVQKSVFLLNNIFKYNKGVISIFIKCTPNSYYFTDANAILIKNQENIDKIHILVDDMRIKYFKIYYFASE